MQPLPHFAAWISRQVNYDIEISIVKGSQLAQKGTVKKMKLTAKEESKEKAKSLKEKIEKSLIHFPTIELKRGFLQIKKG